MGILEILWIYLILTTIQPVITQKWLEASRLRLLRKLERSRGSRVIALVHRQETMSLLGFPILRYINIEDSEEVLRAIKLTDKSVPIDLIAHTPGGLVLAAQQIAHALKNHPAKVTVIVPHYAMSGGSLIALAADEIIMDKMGDQKIEELAETLPTGKWTHDYPLTYEEVKELGLPVSTDMPADVYKFMELFPQPTRRTPSVQYVPMPARQRGGQQNQ